MHTVGDINTQNDFVPVWRNLDLKLNLDHWLDLDLTLKSR